MKFIYPARIVQDEDMFVLEFPDLEGCHTYGDTIEEVVSLAEEALEGYLESLLEMNIPFNVPSKIEDVNQDCYLANYIYCDVNLAKYSKSVKKTLTIPAWLNERAISQGINFSKVLQEALYEAVN